MQWLYDLAEKKHGIGFVQKLFNIANALQINPNWLLAVMWSESGLNHKATNSIGCYGLIQFCNQVWVKQMFGLSALAQLDFVKKYYELNGVGRNVFPKSFWELYLINFYPASFAHRFENTYIIGSEAGLNNAKNVRNHNYLFDVNKDGLISMADFRQFAVNKYAQIIGQSGQQSGAIVKKSNNDLSFILIGLGLALLFSSKNGRNRTIDFSAF